jgi:hypothetical protein
MQILPPKVEQHAAKKKPGHVFSSLVDVAELILSVGPSLYETIPIRSKEKRNVAKKECGFTKS